MASLQRRRGAGGSPSFWVARLAARYVTWSGTLTDATPEANPNTEVPLRLALLRGGRRAAGGPSEVNRKRRE